MDCPAQTSGAFVRKNGNTYGCFLVVQEVYEIATVIFYYPEVTSRKKKSNSASGVRVGHLEVGAFGTAGAALARAAKGGFPVVSLLAWTCLDLPK